MGRTQFFKHGELPLVILALLDQEPMRGFDVMGELDRVFAPDYQASAGSVYPAMKALEEEGLIAGIRGRSKFYELTDTGREALASRRRMIAAIENRTGARLGSDGSLDEVLDRFAERLLECSGRVDPSVVEGILDDTIDTIEGLALGGDKD